MQYIEEVEGAHRTGEVVPSSGGVPRRGGVGPPME